jgi:hypothetical protein
MKSENLNFLELSGPVTGLLYPLILFNFHSYVCCPFCRIIPASFRFDSAFIFVIFYYSFFPLCTYSIFTISFPLFFCFIVCCLTSVSFLLCLFLSLALCQLAVFTLLLSQKWISIYFTGPQITTHKSVCGLACCVDGFGGLVVSMLASGSRVRGFKPDRFFSYKNPQHAFLRRGSQTICPMSQLWGMWKTPASAANYELLAKFASVSFRR